MNFLPTADQLELQRGVRDLLADAFPLAALPGGFDAALWQQLTDIGVFSLRRDLDLGMADAVLVFEELGRACVPGPLVATFLADGLTRTGSLSGPMTCVETHQSPLLVAHLDIATAILVIEGGATGRTVVASRDRWERFTPVAEPLDPLTPLHQLDMTPGGDRIDVDLRPAGAVLTAALQVGLAARLTELGVDYAKQRQQFGRTIGSFQAVKHICADMLVRTELARVAVHAAAVGLDDPSAGDSARSVSGAKVLADDAATANGRGCVQVHGGMGFTWDVPVHFFLKRAWVHATEFGTADDHAEDLAAAL